MSDASRLWIPGPAGRLEGLLRLASPPRAAAVVAHPHPMYGGTLDNAVVFHADRELNRLGLTTLRFNFRGAGRSEGAHDQGPGEVTDLEAVAVQARALAPDVPLVVVGYSFGAWCALRYSVRDSRVHGVIAIGLAVRLHDVGELVERLGRPLAVVQAEQDEFGAPEEVRAVLQRARPPATLRIVPGTSHLFPHRARDVAREVAAAAGEMLGLGAPGTAG